MLEEQKRATQQALQSSTQLENQLDEARNELSTSKKARRQYAAGPKGGRTNLSSNAAEIATLRSSLYQAEQHLEREHHIREHEARQAKAKVTELAGELAAVHEEQAGISASTRSHWRGWRRIAAVAAVGAVTVVGTLIYELRQPASPNASAAPAGVESAGSAPAVLAPASGAPPLAAGVTTPAGIPELAALHRTRKSIDTPSRVNADEKDFGGAVDRLDNALAAFPQPEAVLRAVYKNSKDCALVWNDGHPALIFGGDKGGTISLAETMSQCAHAIEKLR